ncbi:MAG: hydrolase [bacterium]
MQPTILNSENTMLLIIDIQEKLLPAQFNKEAVLKNALALAETCKILDIPMLVSEQYPRGLGGTVSELKKTLPDNTIYFEKVNFGCCNEEGFSELIKSFNKKQIIVCGMESHVCVHQTVYDLIQHGYEVHLIQDAISSRKEYEYKVGIERMKSYGAITSCSEMAIFELLQCAKNPNFKQVQALIK